MMTDGRRLEIPKVLVLEDNTSWREQITQLKADLSKFGGRTADCNSKTWKETSDLASTECDCGWAEVSKGLK